MPYTTPTLVAGIIEVDEDIPLEPFIEAASMLVNRVVAPALDDGGLPFYVDEELEVIERWLSAHFYAVRDPRPVSEMAGRVMARYESEVDLNLNITRYGQQAMLLDVAGGLAQLNQDMKKGGKRKVSIHWGGTAPAEVALIGGL